MQFFKISSCHLKRYKGNSKRCKLRGNMKILERIYIFFIVIRTRNVHFVRENDRSSFKSEVRISNNIFDSIDMSNLDFFFFFFENKLYIRVKTFGYISVFLLFFFIELHESKHDVVWRILKFENWKNIGWNNISKIL